MTSWIRFQTETSTAFGILENNTIHELEGDVLPVDHPTGKTYKFDEVSLLPPCQPQTFIGLWNNFGEAATKHGWEIPKEPLYFLKSPSSILAPTGIIRCPAHYTGRVIFEGELGVVVGKKACCISVSDAHEYIFGYTCVNDITAVSLIDDDNSFAQWCRAKSFDTFGPLGPKIVDNLEVSKLRVRTLLNGKERQNYPISDMIFSPETLLSKISQEITLCPGDVIACGTSLGALPMRPGSTVEVTIDGIGTLQNKYAGN